MSYPTDKDVVLPVESTCNSHLNGCRPNSKSLLVKVTNIAGDNSDEATA